MSTPTAVDTPTPKHKRTVTTRERMLLGGVGGLAPILLNLVVADPSKVFFDFSFPVAAGYIARIIGLFVLGALVAWAHKQERNTLRLFEIGIIAPALVTALINGAAAKGDAGGRRNEGPALIGVLLLPRTVWAQAPGRTRSQGADTLYSFAEPPETRLQQFWRGLTGISSRDRWFVVLDLPVESAAHGASIIRELRRRAGIEARLYGAGGPSAAPFVIVLGDWINEQQATQQARALQSRQLHVFAWYLPR